MTDTYAVRIHQHGGPEVLAVESLDEPSVNANQILVKQTAVGLNFIDTYHRTGLYPVKLPFVPGSEGAGIVEDVGSDVENFSVGDRVTYMATGTYASHIVVDSERAIKLNESVDEETAAAGLLKGLTAWMLLFEVWKARPGTTALVWAAAGGVGTLLVPWATSLGVEVIGIVSTDEKAERVIKAGATHVILDREDVVERVRAITNGRGVDVSLDSVGKTSAKASINSLKPKGLWVSYGNASGPAGPIAPGVLGAKGSLVLTRPGLAHFVAPSPDMHKGASAFFGALRVGTVKPHIGQRYALKDVQSAHRALESRKTVGSTVLIP